MDPGQHTFDYITRWAPYELRKGKDGVEPSTDNDECCLPHLIKY